MLFEARLNSEFIDVKRHTRAEQLLFIQWLTNFFNWNFMYTSMPKGNYAFIPSETILYHF